ncbi:MAG: hypothetical protein JWO58_655 [Chitinophagaceae bacterium]|nr:hypothetical protein [Chitinophagaceae bacterium]
MDKLKKIYPYLFIFLFLLDIVYSFYQHSHVELDGDMASIILPGGHYKKVLEDPFGLSVLLHHEVYAAPNRFFAHWSMSSYFKIVPALLQNVFSPIDSIYYATALAKTAIQVLIIYLLALYISGEKNIGNKNWLLVAILIMPLLQTSGYNGLMGIIDKSITYTFFYALSMVLLLAFFYSFYVCLYEQQKTRWSLASHLLLPFLAIVLAFNGPLVPGVVILVCSMVVVNFSLTHYKKQTRGNAGEKIKNVFLQFPKPLFFHFLFVGILCLYSLFIGMNNIENDGAISVFERYGRIPYGLFEVFTQKIGLPLLLIVLAINLFIIHYHQKENEQKKRMFFLFKAISVFCVVYILMLPLGGYRSYRPDIVRRDTIMPVILCLFYMYGYSTYYIIQQVTFRKREFYFLFIAVVLILFTAADNPITTDNDCERAALKTLAESSEKTVELSSNCKVMSWELITNPKNSETNTELLYIWHVIPEHKLYYQK